MVPYNNHCTEARSHKFNFFSGYKTEVFFFQNNPINLDPSYDGSRSLKLFRKGQTHIIANFHGTDLFICSHSREGKTLSYS